jgi:hypothetical protein
MLRYSDFFIVGGFLFLAPYAKPEVQLKRNMDKEQRKKAIKAMQKINWQKYIQYNLTSEEKDNLVNWVSAMETGEMAQVHDLVENCKSKFQFAKTHSTYLKDWEKTKSRMATNLHKGKFPPGASKNLFGAVIQASDEIMHQKLELVRTMFESKFGESIYNYLGKDGKTKKFLGIFG